MPLSSCCQLISTRRGRISGLPVCFEFCLFVLNVRFLVDRPHSSGQPYIQDYAASEIVPARFLFLFLFLVRGMDMQLGR